MYNSLKLKVNFKIQLQEETGSERRTIVHEFRRTSIFLSRYRLVQLLKFVKEQCTHMQKQYIYFTMYKKFKKQFIIIYKTFLYKCDAKNTIEKFVNPYLFAVRIRQSISCTKKNNMTQFLENKS